MANHSSPNSYRTLWPQVLLATWASILALLVAAGFVLSVVFTANGKESNTIWVSKASVFVAIGATILKGSLSSLIGVVLYQRLWLVLSKSGLRLSQVESYHRASRLSTSMLTQPSASLVWVLGLASLLLVSAIPPVLQAGLHAVPSTKVVERNLTMYHAQLDRRMATVTTAAQLPAGARAIVHRNAVVAAFGETAGHQYTTSNVSGLARTGTVDFVDVSCEIVVEHRNYTGVSSF